MRRAVASGVAQAGCTDSVLSQARCGRVGSTSFARDRAFGVPSPECSAEPSSSDHSTSKPSSPPAAIAAHCTAGTGTCNVSHTARAVSAVSTMRVKISAVRHYFVFGWQTGALWESGAENSNRVARRHRTAPARRTGRGPAPPARRRAAGPRQRRRREPEIHRVDPESGSFLRLL